MRNVLLLLSALLASAVAQAQTESPRTLPYEETFDTAEAGSTYTIVNADNDNYLWKYNAVKKTMGYTGGIGTANDWLITPALSLEADKTYRVNFDTWLDAAWSESAYKHIEVAYGQGEDPSTYTVVQDFLINKAHIFWLEGSHFGPHFDGYARVNIGCPRATLEEMMRRLRAAKQA